MQGHLCLTHSFACALFWKKYSIQKAIKTGNTCIKMVNEINFGHCHPKASHLQAVGVIFQDDMEGSLLQFQFCYMVSCHSGNWTKYPGWILHLTFRQVDIQVLCLLRKRLEIQNTGGLQWIVSGM